MASPLARLLADLRFALRPPRLAPGDLVVVTAPLRYRSRLSKTHLPCVPEGTRGVVRAVAPMPGAPGGAILDILDMAGHPSGYWTGASVDELRRLPPD
ncbi:MAG TPA: hypothetical protein VFY23_09275 [Candidatus Limnocylindrales bacterium]|nr:hypothetical protein [Candidatus Limnocylindrales bacterium]